MAKRTKDQEISLKMDSALNKKKEWTTKQQAQALLDKANLIQRNVKTKKRQDANVKSREAEAYNKKQANISLDRFNAKKKKDAASDTFKSTVVARMEKPIVAKPTAPKKVVTRAMKTTPLVVDKKVRAVKWMSAWTTAFKKSVQSNRFKAAVKARRDSRTAAMKKKY